MTRANYRITDEKLFEAISSYLDECWPNKIPRKSHIAVNLGCHPLYFSRNYPTALYANAVVDKWFEIYERRLCAYAYQVCKDHATTRRNFGIMKAAKELGLPRSSLAQNQVWANIRNAIRQGIMDGRKLRGGPGGPQTRQQKPNPLNRKIHLTTEQLAAVKSDREWVKRFNELAKSGQFDAAEKFADWCLETLEHLQLRGVV